MILNKSKVSLYYNFFHLNIVLLELISLMKYSPIRNDTHFVHTIESNRLILCNTYIFYITNEKQIIFIICIIQMQLELIEASQTIIER